MRFKSAILVEQNKPLVVGELQIPELDVGQVLVRVRASGICGAQIGEISGAKGPDRFLPHLLGHEGGGIVEEVGPGATKVKPGDHVVMHWRKGAGIEAKPPRYRWGVRSFTGIGLKDVGGGWVTTFNEMAVVSENRLTPISKAIPFEVAALMGCAVTTALGLVENEARVRMGESVLVVGCGGVGLNVIQAALLAGAWPVYGVDRQGHKQIMALGVGAAAASGQLDGYKDIDVLVDCTGDPRVIAQGYEVIKPQTGRMILVGQPGHDQDLVLPCFRRHYCGKTILDSQGGLTVPDRDIPRYLGLWKAGRLPVQELITHRFPLDQVNEALDTVRSGEAGRVILEM